MSDKWSKSKNLYNMYGPTEGTCGATIKRLTPGARVTIGGPNPTTRLYILGSQRNMVIPGVIGEIYIAGIQVAKGYLDLPDETRKRFLPDHISCNGERMYRTGDKGYWNETGEVICLGRNDRQIKLRGFRLDMNDLEIRVAGAFPELEAVAIAPQKDHLVAMVQPASTDISKLVSRISTVLPSYAVPRHVVATDSFPTTRVGKVDYNAMSEMVYTKVTQESRVLSTSTERTLATAFRAILELDNQYMIRPQSRFIDLGGSSLQQFTLSLQLTRSFGVHIPLQLIIEHPMVEDLARAIDSFMSRKRTPVVHNLPLDEQSVSLIEESWLERYQLDAGSSCFNVSFTSTFADDMVDRTRLTDTWNTVISMHLLLRSRYITRRDKAPRRIYSDYAPRVERVQSLGLWAEINRPFQLDRTSPIRVHITEDRLVVVLSHIVADYTTLAILLKEASVLYSGLALPPVRTGYLEALLKGESTKACYLDFWAKYLEGCPKAPTLFGRHTERHGYWGTSVVSELPKAVAHDILAYARSTSFTLQQLVTSAVALCLQLEAPHTDIAIGMPYINRPSEEALETVGLFVEPLPVRVQYSPGAQKDNDGPRPSFLESVRDSSQAALAHAVPWHQLLERLAVTNPYPNSSLPDVMVSFHDSRQAASLRIAAPGFEPCFVWSQGSKFKLMCEFTALASVSSSGDKAKILLRLEYDPDCVRAEEVAILQRCVPEALQMLVRGLGYEETKANLLLRSRDIVTGVDDGEAKKDYFGCELREILEENEK